MTAIIPPTQLVAGGITNGPGPIKFHDSASVVWSTTPNGIEAAASAAGQSAIKQALTARTTTVPTADPTLQFTLTPGFWLLTGKVLVTVGGGGFLGQWLSGGDATPCKGSVVVTGDAGAGSSVLYTAVDRDLSGLNQYGITTQEAILDFTVTTTVTAAGSIAFAWSMQIPSVTPTNVTAPSYLTLQKG